MEKVAVIGSGTMGNGIAHVFAQCKYTVALIDINELALSKALKTIETNLERQVAKGTIDLKEKLEALERITTFSDMKEGVKDADLVVEAATEQLPIKLNIFKQLDKLCQPKAILASNTSSISITQIAAATARRTGVISPVGRCSIVTPGSEIRSLQHRTPEQKPSARYSHGTTKKSSCFGRAAVRHQAVELSVAATKETSSTPSSTCSPSRKWIAATRPSAGAGSECSIFMASRTSKVSPRVTSWPSTTFT